MVLLLSIIHTDTIRIVGRRCSDIMMRLLEITNTALSNLKYYISMKDIAFTYHLACITDQ